MNPNEQFYSYKKNPTKELLQGSLIIVFALLLGFGFYSTLDYLIFDRFGSIGLFDNFEDYLPTFSLTLTIIFGLVVLAFIISLLTILFLLLRNGIKKILQRERVILAKVNRMSAEISGELEDSLDSPNASFSKSLAKLFKQVTIHQKASNGKIESIYFYVSQTKSFSYPSAKVIFDQLAGVCEPLGIEVSLFTESDHIEYISDFSERYGNPIPYQMKGIVLSGEPAYQHVKRFTAPIDSLVETIVSKSKGVEIHTFNSIRQGSPFRFWLRKRTLPRTKTKDGKDRTLSKKELHKISETEDMLTSGYVYGEVAVLIKGTNNENLEEIENKMLGSLETIYDGFTRKISVDKINYKKLLRKIRNHELVANQHSLISGLSARAIIDVYRKPMSGIPIVKNITTPPSEKRPKETHPIVIGETITGEEVRTCIDDHIHHCGIFGTTGYGKSEWIQAEIEQILEHYPKMRIMIFDFDGEYARAFANRPDFLILEANSKHAPLHINPFEGELDDLVKHADSLFTYFNEVLSIDQKYGEFTPPQKSILWEGIIATVEGEGDSTTKNYSVFEQKTREYIDSHRDEYVRGDISEKSLMLKLKFYKRELRNIVMCNQSNFTMDMLENTNVIFNLKSILNETGKRAITTLLLYQLRNYALKKGTRDLWLKTYIEEAVVVTPNAEKGQKLFVDECLTVIRKQGVSFSLIGTLAKKITEFILESPYLVNTYTISDVLSKKMNTDLRIQHSLKKFRVDIKLPDEEHPIRLMKLTRPKHRKLTQEEYEHFLLTSPKYEELRSSSFLLDDIDFQDYKLSLINKCLEDCNFNFYNSKDCLLQKRYKVIDLLKDNLREFIKNNGGLQGAKELLDSDLSLAIDKIMIEVTSTVRNHSKIGHILITQQVEKQVTKCAFTWLLNELIHNQTMTKTEAYGYLFEFEKFLDELQTSSYGFEDELPDYTFDVGDYEDAWGEN